MRFNPSRNDPCPCGSGQKYKKCCFKQESALQPLPSPIIDIEVLSGRKLPPTVSTQFSYVKINEINNRFEKYITKIASQLVDELPMITENQLVECLLCFIRNLSEEDFLAILDKTASLLEKSNSIRQKGGMILCKDLSCNKLHDLFWASTKGEAYLIHIIQKYNFVEIINEISRFYFQNPILLENLISMEALQRISVRQKKTIEKLCKINNNFMFIDSLVILLEQIGLATEFKFLPEHLSDDVQMLCQKNSAAAFKCIRTLVLQATAPIEAEVLKDLEQKQRSIEQERLEAINFKLWQKKEKDREDLRILERERQKLERERQERLIIKGTQRILTQQYPLTREKLKIKKTKEIDPEILNRSTSGLVLAISQIPSRFLPSILKQGGLRDQENVYFASEEALHEWQWIIEQYLAQEEIIEEVPEENRTLFIAGARFNDIPIKIQKNYQIYHMEFAPNKWPSVNEIPRPDAVLVRIDFCSHSLFYFAREVAKYYKVPFIFGRSYVKIIKKAQQLGTNWLERRNPNR